ncbi:ankyrin repeat domain-containing protein [Pseudothauera rhizosphaerae]|uniref:Rhodanese domain-containing protein n=1 Tax=Pseudothauera rhizosphaerae TaxID=2565932 RepID=A0A4S4A992_9RHOO|nr:ankyrin repeat domain-containing protein [Pseudothauera rhizosphaerae]THF55370.1 hypothetical protein E6O51_20755 [Pseudothauera rhizosphaerae]
MTTATTAAHVTDRSQRRIAPADAADMLARWRSGALPTLALFDVRDARSYAQGHVEGAEHLSDAGFPAAARRLTKDTPVLIYCYHGNASRTWAQTFADFRFAEVWSVDGGYDALAAAITPLAGQGHAPCRAEAAGASLVAFLVEYGFDLDDLDAPRAHGLTPLMRAALVGRADLVDELVQLGVSVARRNMDGNNALWLACVGGSADAVCHLVAAGIDVDNRNDMGATCLMYCASAGKADTLALLLECGADPLLTNFDDARAADLAATRECLKLLRHTAR